LAEFLADSFAFIAHFEGNPRYVRIFSTAAILTTAMNVVEIHSTLLRRVDPEKALVFSKLALAKVIDVPSEVAIRAAEFKRKMTLQKLNCSHIDAWGYCAAQALRMKFLTGDPVFKGLENVEFVR
jgi:hypothetical protein